MKKFMGIALALVILTMGGLAGCGNQGSPSAPPSVSPSGTESPSPSPAESKTDSSKLRVAHLTGRLGDEGFKDAVMRGVQKFADETGCELTVVENAELNDFAQNARNFAQEGYDMIVVTEGSASELIVEFAADYPETHFLINSAKVEGVDNITCTLPAQQEMAFLSGAFNVLMNKELGGGAKSGMLCGIRGGQDIAVYGFMAGSKYVGGEATVVYVGNFTDVAKGKEIALQMYQEDLKLLQTFAGGAGVGGFQAAESMPDGYYAMGSADGQFHMSDRIIASTIQDNAAAYYHFLTQFANGELLPGLQGRIDISSGAADFQIAPNYIDFVPQEIQDTIADLKAKIVAGEIVPPDNEADYNAFLTSLS